MKRLFGCIAVFAAALISLCAFASCGGNATVKYTLSDDGGYYIVSGVSGNKLSLSSYTIPAEYDGLPVKEIGEQAFSDCTALEKITIPYGVERIDSMAFKGCRLNRITIPDSVTEIAFGAFAMCDYLAEVTVPQSVESLGAYAFAYCKRLQRAYVKANITDLPQYAFYNTVESEAGQTYTDTLLTEVYLSCTIERISITALAGNFITDIYFEGTSSQWSEMYFYSTTEDETSPDGYRYDRVDASSIIPSSVRIHCDYVFED